MLNIALQKVLAWLAGVTPDQWQLAKLMVMNAADIFVGEADSAKRRAFVASGLAKAFPNLSPGVVNLLVEVAASYRWKTKN